ncbi:tyrosine-type recombinase/integrase [Alistipes ihumii]|uniref:tyrosine-type recombinase/integrase n=1 Tax=Alistipes ihumii TaxID=1470347 RepID=UPI0026588118|nr:tyrosine-type recombinase/integrase [Alistipes ihumii]
MKKQKKAAEDACNYFTEQCLIPESWEFWEQFDQLLAGEVKPKEVFCSYMDHMIQNNVTHAVSTRTKWKSVLRLLHDFENENKMVISFKWVASGGCEKITQWMYRKGFSNNYAGGVLRIVKRVYNEARDEMGLKPLLGVKIESHPMDAIYLTLDEIEAIAGQELTREAIAAFFADIGQESQLSDYEVKMYNVARAKFLFGCYTGLRVSDYNSLRELNIRGGIVNVYMRKTKKKVSIPLNSRAQELIKSGLLFESIPDQDINVKIKIICRMTGAIDYPVEVIKHIAGQTIVEEHLKWELVTNHTARRSFATNLLLSGEVSLFDIMLLLGHSSIETTRNYLRISADENAQRLSKLNIFK